MSNVKQQLLRMAEAITANAHYPCNLGNLNILFQYEFYFDICQIIFPQLNIQLVKIKEDDLIDQYQKMNRLIDLLTRQLQIDLSFIKGAEIIKGEHISHVHKFLQFLEKFSEYQEDDFDEDSGSRRVKSDPNLSERKQQNKKQPRSAREKRKREMENEPIRGQQRSLKSAKGKRQNKKRAPSYSAAKKQKRNREKASQNLYNSLINLIMNEKNRAIKASLRDNRKVKNQELIQAKNKYKSYLYNYAKQNKAARNRQLLLKAGEGDKERRQLPLQQFDNINQFFKSFQLKIRDQKYCYLKRVEKQIRGQQIDRMCYLNKVSRQNNNVVKKSTKKEMDRIENEHKVKSGLLKQSLENEKQMKKIRKKNEERDLRQQKKELKENKKKELNKIIDYMQQQNGKVLMSLQQGGRLEKTIMDMYKRF